MKMRTILAAPIAIVAAGYGEGLIRALAPKGRAAIGGVYVPYAGRISMDLLALDTSVKYMVTGAVLLGAVIIDAIARQKRQASGRT